MLIQFTVSNFLSIKDPVTLSMVASSDTTLPGNIIDVGSDRYLTSAVIYGANASGKSNVLKAFGFMQYLVSESHKFQRGDIISNTPFLMDKKSINQPSNFEIHFISKGIRYIYGFSVDQNEVHAEYLFYHPKGKKRTVFIRTKDNKFTFTSDKKKQQIIADTTLNNTLYLSKATQSNYIITTIPFEWIRHTLRSVISFAYRYDIGFVTYTGQRIYKNPTFKKIVLSFLQNADIGIDDIEVKMIKAKQKEASGDDPDDKITYSIITKHNSKTNDSTTRETMQMNINYESNGTVKLFGLIGPLMDVLENGYTLVYDELDTRLHPILTRLVVSLFNDHETNPNKAQLIFNTHDVNLLDSELLRRDQIWFTEKKEDGSTDLYPLSDFKPRKDDKLMKNYLLGRYGAIPIIGDASMICGEE